MIPCLTGKTRADRGDETRPPCLLGLVVELAKEGVTHATLLSVAERECGHVVGAHGWPVVRMQIQGKRHLPSVKQGSNPGRQRALGYVRNGAAWRPIGQAVAIWEALVIRSSPLAPPGTANEPFPLLYRQDSG